MPTFLDESGDTGHKRDSAHYFRLAAVWFPASALVSYAAEIARMRHEQQWAASFEPKYNKTHNRPERRRSIYECALRHGFRFAVCCIDKRRGVWQKAGRDHIHWVATTTLAATLRPHYLASRSLLAHRREEFIRVDRNDDGKFLEVVSDSFRGVGLSETNNIPLVEKAVWGDSARDVFLQLADLVCGAVGEHVEGNGEWYKVIRSAALGVDGGSGSGVTCWP